MRLYLVIRTARKDVREFPGYFPYPERPTLCGIDNEGITPCTQDRAKAEEVIIVQTEEYGKYFDYKIYELEIVE